MQLVFDCTDVVVNRYAASPTLDAIIQISETTGETVHSIGLHCQVRIEAQLRSYTDEQKKTLYDIFGEPHQWGDTLTAMQFAAVSHAVPKFTGSVEVAIPLPCSYDLDVAAGRYFDALEDGEIPLLFLFSGTVFLQADNGFQIAQVPWNKEASFRLPADRWRQLMDLYFPGQGWLRLQRDTISKLLNFKNDRALSTWDHTIDALIKEAEA